jgi:hypothetical protein
MKTPERYEPHIRKLGEAFVYVLAGCILILIMFGISYGLLVWTTP